MPENSKKVRRNWRCLCQWRCFCSFVTGSVFVEEITKKISNHFLIIIITVTDILQDVIVIIFWTWIRYTFDTINKNTCKIFHKLCFQKNCGDTEEFFPSSPSLVEKLNFSLWNFIFHFYCQLSGTSSSTPSRVDWTVPCPT